MTEKIKGYSKKRSIIQAITALAILLLILNSKAVAASVYSGAVFAISCLIPTLFPFFIVSDLLLAYGVPFEKRLRRGGAYVIIIGLVCGFPHGARIASRIFSEGQITKKEYERLLILSSCPSLAFVVSGIGAGMLGNILYGIILYASLVFSVLTLAAFVRNDDASLEIQPISEGKSFDLIESVKNAGSSSITIASLVVFFYAINSLISVLIKDKNISLLLSILLEIGSGTAGIAESDCYSLPLKTALLGFACGFSSLSVFMQCSAFISKKANKKKLILFKLIQGVVCALYAFMLTIIYKRWLPS